MTPSFISTLRTQLIWLTGSLALMRFFVVDCGSILHQLDLPSSLANLPDLQFRLAPLVDRATLFCATVVLILALPSLVRGKRGQKVGFLDETLALGILVFVGALAINALAHEAWSLGLADGVLAILFLIAALRLALSDLSIRLRLPVAALLLCSSLPLLWRTLLESGVSSTSPGLTMARTVADCASLGAWGLLILTINQPRQARLATIPIIITGAVIWFAMTSYDDYRHVLASISGLWYTTMTATPIIILTGLATFAMLTTWVGKNRVSLSFALILLASAAHQAGNPTSLILQSLGLLTLVVWARYRQDTTQDLPSILP
ncbi:MAG: hypothetical protein ACI97A_001471 [Planctomycetota bacterium]|jgi:hypothetical protein